MKILISLKIFMFFGMVIFFSTLVLACTGANQGGLRMSRDVNNLFESYQVLDNYNYYYSGPDARPNAILGIHDDYTLRSDLWKAVDLTPDQLRLWIRMMTDHRGTSLRTYGARVIAPDGKDIGIWYSPWNWTAVRMEDDRHVVINTPVESPMDREKRFFFWGGDEF
jgi:hypothetical protein